MFEYHLVKALRSSPIYLFHSLPKTVLLVVLLSAQAVWLFFIGDVTILARTLFELQFRLIKKFPGFLLNILVLFLSTRC